MIRLESGRRIRNANRHFFEESDIRRNRTQKQHPYLVVRPTKTRVNLDVVYNAETLLDLPETTKVLAQWKGRNRSDYYRFTVRDLKKYIEANPKTASQRI